MTPRLDTMSMLTILFSTVCVCTADNTNGCTNRFPDIRMMKSGCNHSASMDISPIEMPPAASVFDAREANLPPNMHTESPDFIPRCGDVRLGRGGRTNEHPGNMRLREIVKYYWQAYNQARTIDKHQVSKSIVSALRNANPPSRFLRHNEGPGRWEDVGDKRAAEKVSQTLRKKDQCSHEGSTNQSSKGGVCKTHGVNVKRKLCDNEGCTRKQCSLEGCAKFAQRGGVCQAHGAKVKRCSHEDCKNNPRTEEFALHMARRCKGNDAAKRVARTEPRTGAFASHTARR